MKRVIGLAVAVIFLAIGSYAQAAAGFTKLASSTTTSYTDAACQNQTTCYYQVTAVDAQGHESPAAACSTTVLCFAGNQGVAVMPSSGTHSVALSWTASTTLGVTYNVYKAIGPLPAANLGITIN